MDEKQKSVEPKAAMVWPIEIMDVIFAAQIREEARYRGEI